MLKTQIISKSTFPLISVCKLICKNHFSSCTVTMDSNYMLQNFKRCIPPLDGSGYKGQAGIVGVVGGSLEYTGAPYFAAISALKAGADLVHVFCTTPAATVIKSYSPELIVHPLLDTPTVIADISVWLHKFHAVVVGPGLGRNPTILKTVSEIIEILGTKSIPLILDADGLHLLANKPELIKNFKSPVIVTPNKNEFERLCERVNGVSGLKQLCENITILKKGSTDEVLSRCAEVEWKSDAEGSGRRCGGQGDLLSGSIATFLHWTTLNQSKLETTADKPALAASISCYAASRMIRLCNKKSFKVKGRSMLATDMVDNIHESFEELFGQ